MSDMECYEMYSLLSWHGPIDQANNQDFWRNEHVSVIYLGFCGLIDSCQKNMYRTLTILTLVMSQKFVGSCRQIWNILGTNELKHAS